jgi:hypothetical protein
MGDLSNRVCVRAWLDLGRCETSSSIGIPAFVGFAFLSSYKAV